MHNLKADKIQNLIVQYLQIILFSHKIVVSAVFGLIFLWNISDAQHVLSQLEIHGGTNAAGFENMITDDFGNIYLGFKYSPYLPVSVGDTVLYGSRLDTLAVNFYLRDMYLVKLNEDHEFQRAFVTVNAEEIQDYCTTGADQILAFVVVK